MRLTTVLAVILAFSVLFLGCIAIPIGKNATTPGTTPPPTSPPAIQPPSQAPEQPPEQPPSQPPEQPPEQPPSQPPSEPSNPPSENAPPPSEPPPSAGQLTSSEISYMSEAWKIYGTVYPSKNPSPTKAIIFAHKLGADRSEWPESIIVRLHDEIPDAMIIAIDMRGHGKSTNMGTYKSFDMATFKDMKTDIISAKKYINPKYPTVSQLYVVGSSIGSTAAILAAQQEQSIDKVAMISPGMKYEGVDITRAIEEYPQPLLVAAAGNDAESVQAVHAINSLSNEIQLTSKIYIASSHGAALIEETKTDAEPLSDLLVNFLKK